MKYFHRTQLSPDTVMEGAAKFFGARLAPAEELPRRLRFTGAIGRIAVTVQAEGGHYTLVTLATDQVTESEADRLAKRFLTLLHTQEHPSHRPIGAY